MVGVSTDDEETLRRFREQHDLPYPLVSDPQAEIAAAYQARWPLVRIARRVSYLIGRDRKVRFAFRSERDARAHAEQVLREAARSG